MPFGKKKKKQNNIPSQDNEEKVRFFDYRSRIAEVFRPKKNRCYCCKPAYLLKTQIQEEWEGRMDDSLSLRVYKYLFPKNAKQIEFPKFCNFYADLVEKDAEARAKTMCKLSNVFTDEPNVDQDTTMDCLLKVVSSIIGSFFENMAAMGLKELIEWTGMGAISCSVDNYQLAASLSADIPITTQEDGTLSKVKADDIAVWVSHCPLLDDIMNELFKSLFGIVPDSEFNSFLPYPCQEYTLARTLLALPNILILNNFTRKRQAKKWTSVFSSAKTNTETWESFLSTVRGKGPTVTIVQDKHGGIFGMYASQRWFEDENFYGNDESFLFTLKPEVNMYSASGKDSNFQFFNEQGVGMGGEKNEFGLFIDHSLRKGFTAETCQTFTHYSPLSSETEFEIKTIEIWTVSTVSARQSASFFLKDDELESIMQGAGLIKKETTSDTCACDELILESTTLEEDDSSEESVIKTKQVAQPGRSSDEEASDAIECGCHEGTGDAFECGCNEAAGDAQTCLCDVDEGSKELASPASVTGEMDACSCKSSSNEMAESSGGSIQTNDRLNQDSGVEKSSDENKTPSMATTRSRKQSTVSKVTEKLSEESFSSQALSLPKDALPCSCSPTNGKFSEEDNTSNLSDRSRGNSSSRRRSKMKIKMIRPNVCKCTTVELMFPKFSQFEAVEVFYENSKGTTLVQ